MTKGWVVQGGTYSINRNQFKVDYDLVDPGKAVGVAPPPPPPPPPPPDPGDDPRTQDFVWQETSYTSRLSSSPVAINSWFDDDLIGGYGKMWYPESDIYWIGPDVHPLPADPRDTENVSYDFYLPPKPGGVTVILFVQLRPYINWIELNDDTTPRFYPRTTDARINGNIIPPLAPYTYPVSDSRAYRYPWRADFGALFDAINHIQASHDITGLVPLGSPPANSTVHAILNVRVEYLNVPYDKAFSAVCSVPSGSATGLVLTKAEPDTIDTNEMGTYSAGTWTCDEDGWYGIVGDTAFVPPASDYRNTTHYAVIKITGVEQQNTSLEASTIYYISRVGRIAYLHVGDDVSLWGWHRTQFESSGSYRTLQFNESTRLSIYKLLMA